MPPAIWMARECLLRKSMERTAFDDPNATSRNGRPRPMQYATTSSTPRAAVSPWVPTDTEMIDANVGPKHGVHPSANTPPSSGAPRIVVHFLGCMRVSFCSAGTAPMNTRPMRMVTTPPMRVSVWALSAIALAAPNTVTVASRNTTVNPATNNVAAPATAQCLRATRGPLSSMVISPPTTPVRYEM